MPAIDIFLDTSVLPRNPANPRQEYEHLIELVEARLVKVHLSDIARREWRTQMQDKFVAEVREAGRQAASLTRHRLSKELVHSDRIEQLAGVRDEMIEDAGNVAGHCCDQLLERLKVTVHPVAPEDCAAVLDGYFAGTPPYSDVKARNDFPDAFILQALKRLAVLIARPVQALAADERLGKAFSEISGVTRFPGMKELLASPAVQTANESLELAKEWTRERENDVVDGLSGHTAFLQSTIQMLAERELFQISAYGNIPEDNSKATVTGVRQLRNINLAWDNHENLGPGWIGVRLSFDCDADLDFMVYRADALHVPDWVHVDLGDFEENHYFEASGNRTIHVEGMLTIRFTLEELRRSSLPAPQDVEFYEIDSVEIVHDDDDDVWLG